MRGTGHFIIAAIVACASAVAIADREPVVVLNEKYPTFTAPNLMGEGEIDFADFHDRVVIVEFWRTQCGICKSSAPHLLALYEKYHKDGLEIISIPARDTEKNIRAFVKKKGLVWHHASDPDRALARRHSFRRFPGMFLIDRDGICIWSGNQVSELAPLVEKIIRQPWDGEEEQDAKAQVELTKADEFRDAGKAKEAREAYEAVVERYPGTDTADIARKSLDSLDKHPKIVQSKKSRSAAAASKRYLEVARKRRDAGKTDDARRYYQRVIDKYPDSDEAKTAADEMAALPE